MKKVTELLTIPGAIILMMGYNWTANLFGLHTFTWEQVSKVFPAFVIYLIAVGFVRLTHMWVWPKLYRYFDPSYQENYQWKILSEKERFVYSFWLHVALFILFGLIVNGL